MELGGRGGGSLLRLVSWCPRDCMGFLSLYGIGLVSVRLF